MQLYQILWEKQFITRFGRSKNYFMHMGKRFGKESLEAYALRPLENDSFKRISLLRGPYGIDGLISGICLLVKSVFPKKSYRVER